MTSLTLHTSLKALSSNTFGFWEGTIQGFPSGSVGKESAYNAGDLGSIPGSGRYPGEEMATHSSILAWRISWTEEPGRLQSMHGVTKSRT